VLVADPLCVFGDFSLPFVQLTIFLLLCSPIPPKTPCVAPRAPIRLGVYMRGWVLCLSPLIDRMERKKKLPYFPHNNNQYQEETKMKKQVMKVVIKKKMKLVM
jgi:hypothetical protein